jgi:hypothetical protein
MVLAMKTCAYDGEPNAEPRAHPWTDAVGSSACRYYDLKAAPGLIRTALEDFVPFGHFAAVTEFYTLLERLNAPASTLESNDCAFSAPHASELAAPGKLLQCEGRLMILFRELGLNLSRPRVEALEHGLHQRLAELDRELEWGLVGTTIYPTRFVTLPGAPARQLGHQLMLSFWAWGDTEAEVMGHLERVVRNLAQAIREGD